MPRMALADTLAAVCIGRPICCLEPPPDTSSGVLDGGRLGEHARELALVDGAHVA